MSMTPLEIREALLGLKGWEITDEGRIENHFAFADFTRAILFINKIVNPIEEFQSYPWIDIAYNRVKVSLYNVETGGITEKEIRMADEIAKLAQQTQ